MSDLRRKLAIAKSLEKLRKFDFDEKLKEVADARALVDDSELEFDKQQQLITRYLGYANENSKKSKLLSPAILEAQSEYFCELYAQLENIKEKLDERRNVFHGFREDLKGAHARKRLASKNSESLKNKNISERVKRDMKDNFLPVEKSRETLL